MLSLGCVGQVFPDRWEQLVHGHLVQVQEVSQFFPREIGDTLVICLFSSPRLLFSVAAQLYHYLPNV